MAKIYPVLRDESRVAKVLAGLPLEWVGLGPAPMPTGQGMLYLNYGQTSTAELWYAGDANTAAPITQFGAVKYPYESITFIQTGTTDNTPVIQRMHPEYIIGDGTAAMVTATIRASSGETGGAEACAFYKLMAYYYKSTGGTLTQKGTTVVLGSFEDDSSWNATLSVDSNDVALTITGDATDEVAWYISLRLFASLS